MPRNFRKYGADGAVITKQDRRRHEKPLSWLEVLARHGSRRGIRVTPTQASLLLDFGLSAYINHRTEGCIRYEGEGKRGDQQATHGNAALLECLETGRALTVFERVRPGVWFDGGSYRVIQAQYIWRESERRYVFEFILEQQP